MRRKRAEGADHSADHTRSMCAPGMAQGAVTERSNSAVPQRARGPAQCRQRPVAAGKACSCRSQELPVFEGQERVTARAEAQRWPAGEPCEVSIKNRTSFSASIFLAATCNDVASASIVAPPPLFELYCTLIGPFPNRLATI